MREFLLHIFASLLLTIAVITTSSIIITFILWDYTWVFTDDGLIYIRILVMFTFIFGIHQPFSKLKKEKLKEHDEKISN